MVIHPGYVVPGERFLADTAPFQALLQSLLLQRPQHARLVPPLFHECPAHPGDVVPGRREQPLGRLSTIPEEASKRPRGRAHFQHVQCDDAWQRGQRTVLYKLAD
eukprot:2686390-Rhodomonas_salina.1